MLRSRRPSRWIAAHRKACKKQKGAAIKINFSCIFVSDLRKLNKSAKKAAGFCVDVGAPRSVIGLKDLHRFRSMLSMKRANLHPSENRFRFGDSVYDSLGQVTLQLDTPHGIPSIDV